MRAPRGMSLLELLVGMTVGLLILLAVSSLLAGLLGNQARDRRQAQLGAMVDASLSLMAMEIRRAGYWQGFDDPAKNPYGRIYIEQNGRCLRYGYDTPPAQKAGTPRFFAFRLKEPAAQGKIQRLSSATDDPASWSCAAPDNRWDDLSKPDIGVVKTLAFSPDASGKAILLQVEAHTPAGPDQATLDIHTSIALRNHPALVKK
ncbi:prepilin-type N-terminal cleavage/methylation domain-containing protein [Chromobacterium sp. IIBBL 290-4]|uniref:prepilin-type N-terminal cleavage/methylation domain-containing protein n=1 Tax=Chromobacterium sp. IIBBL 290-4 TaxID=2953890 RepID=UPI0020B6B406|nr:prepilin-type N-terminal cleavage/methylation domain-containing protein [Chromobacterium sp. IIBBL 290-4]UTH76510.1 hypothetical protein NKT35_10600 [Chromobacterium sp. IIBBL 290-4]